MDVGDFHRYTTEAATLGAREDCTPQLFSIYRCALLPEYCFLEKCFCTPILPKGEKEFYKSSCQDLIVLK